MIRNRKFLLPLVLTLALSILPWSVQADEYAAKEQELARVDQARQEAKALLDELAKNESEIMAELHRLEQDLAAVVKDLAVVEQDVQRTRTRIAEVRKDAQEANSICERSQAELAEVLSRYNQRLRAIYMSGGADVFDILLETGDVADLALRTRMFAAILAEDVALYDQLTAKERQAQADQALLDEQLRRLKTEESRLTRLQETTALRVKAVKKAKTQRDEALARILGEKQTQRKVLAEYEENSRKIEEWLEQHKTPPLPTGDKGRVRLKVPIKAAATTGYGWQLDPADGVKRFHEGVDFEAAEGTLIQAAAGGRVILAGWVGGYGYTVIVEHSGDLSTVYAHSSRVLVEVGDLVEMGQVIAEVGATGLTEGPRLHFEVRSSGRTADPAKYLGE